MLPLLGCTHVAELATLPSLAAQAPPSRTEEYGAPGRVLPVEVLDPAACGAFDAREFVGAHFTELAALSLQGQMRILWPGQRVTDEVQPQRLNVQVSDSGTVRQVFCG